MYRRVVAKDGWAAAWVCIALVYIHSGAQAQVFLRPDAAATLKALGPAASGARIAYTPRGDIQFLGAPPGQNFSATLKGMPTQVAQDFLEIHAKGFGVRSPRLAFTESRIQDGKEHAVVRLDQTYAGLPVYGAQALIQVAKSGGVRCAVLDILRETARLDAGKVQLVPTLRPEDAATLAFQESEKHYGGKLFLPTRPDLAIYAPEVLGDSGPPALAWRLVIAAESGAAYRQQFLIDAHTGEILLHFSLIHTAKNRVIYDANNTSAEPGDLVRIEGGPVSGIVDADLAYDFVGDAYDFYMEQHGRDSIDGAGMDLSVTVRYCDPEENCPYANAFWDAGRMYFGQGFAAADDVVAHELAHGVTEYESGLIYYNQSGAINESLSDVWGEFVDLVNGKGTDTSPVRWLVGEDLGQGNGIRNMANPPAFGDPDRMCSPLWYRGFFDNGGVHSNSGVNNKLCFLLTDGGEFNGRSIAGMGIPRVAALYYEAQTSLLTPAADYVDLYNALTQAAIHLGYSEAERQNLEAACLAVEISPANTCWPSPLPPLNDACEEAIPMALSVSYAGNNARATGDTGLCFEDDTNSVWYSFTPAVSASYRLSLCSTTDNTDTTMGIFTGTCASLEPIACNDDSCGYYSELTLDLTAGLRYLIAVAGYGGLGGGFTLRMDGTADSGLCGSLQDAGFELGPTGGVWRNGSTHAIPPLCDISTCESPWGTAPRNGSAWAWLGGTTGAPEARYLEQAVLIPPASGGVLTFYLKIPVAETLGILRVLLDGVVLFTASEADQASFSTYKLVPMDIAPYADGRQHTLRLESQTEQGTGPIAFFVDDVCISTFGLPLNDECTGALPAHLNAVVSGSTLGATPSPLLDCMGAYTNDLWYQFSPLEAGDYEFSVCGEDFDATLEVWDSCGGLVLACQDEDCVQAPALCLPMSAEESCLVRVGGMEGGAGRFSLQISRGSCTPAEGEALAEGASEGEAEGTGEGTGEGVFSPGVHAADWNADAVISLAELLRVIQLFNAAAYHCALPASSSEDGYLPGVGSQNCRPHDADYAPQNWLISLSELLRVIQFYNSSGYFFCPDTASEDGYCPEVS